MKQTSLQKQVLVVSLLLCILACSVVILNVFSGGFIKTIFFMLLGTMGIFSLIKLIRY
jgi:hypothetical protein